MRPTFYSVDGSTCLLALAPREQEGALCAPPMHNTPVQLSLRPFNSASPHAVPLHTLSQSLMLVRAYVNASAAADRPGCRRVAGGSRRGGERT